MPGFHAITLWLQNPFIPPYILPHPVSYILLDFPTLQSLAHSRPAINIRLIELHYGVGGLKKNATAQAFQEKCTVSKAKHGGARYFWMALHKCCVGFLSATKCHCISFLVHSPALGCGGLCNQSLGMSHC